MKRLFFSLVVLIFPILFQALPVEAQSNSVISLEENIVLPNSDVELIASGGERFYAQVSYQGKEQLFLSENRGRSWQKMPCQGLPENEKFIILETPASQPDVVVLATKTMVYLSRNGGRSFESLAGPAGLTERGEEITSLAVEGNPPQILVGIWHPNQGKFPEEGVSLWGFNGKSSWEAQCFRPNWLGGENGYFADVTSVAFSYANILAVATGDPGTGEGTYLNIAYPAGQRTQWNGSDFPGWPVEISQTACQSPKETEILNSRIAISDRWGSIYVAYNTREKTKDDVYLVKFGNGYHLEGYQAGGVSRLGLPKTPEKKSIDDIAYCRGFLAVGLTTVEGVHVFLLNGSYWQNMWLRSGGKDAFNCQLAVSKDIICASASGQASFFARTDRETLLPISLIDTSSAGINQISLSSDFLNDRTLYLNYGNQNLFRLALDNNYRLEEVARIFYYQSFDPAMIRIGASGQNIFLFEAGKKKFWLSRDGGLNWLPAMEKETEITDAQVFGDKVWLAGKDGSIYLCLPSGVTQDRISSGLAWVGRIAPGPDGKVLVAGGSKEWFFEAVSLVSPQSYQALPAFPVVTSSSEGYKLGYSPLDNSIYCGVNNQLYRTVSGSDSWEKVAEFENWVNEILVPPQGQGLYVFVRPRLYFSHFPINKNSQWTQVGKEVMEGENFLGCRLAEADNGEDLLIFWDNSKIKIFTNQPGDKPREEVSPPPVTPEPVKPKTTFTPDPTPTQTPTPAPTPTPKPVTQPPAHPLSVDWSQIWLWIAIIVGVFLATFFLLTVLAK